MGRRENFCIGRHVENGKATIASDTTSVSEAPPHQLGNHLTETLPRSLSLATHSIKHIVNERDGRSHDDTVIH